MNTFYFAKFIIIFLLSILYFDSISEKENLKNSQMQIEVAYFENYLKKKTKLRFHNFFFFF